MKYVVFDNSKDIPWEMVYCNCHDRDETPEDILKSIISHTYIGKFRANKHVCAYGCKIKNDDNLYILSYCGHRYIWQIGSKVADMEGFIIPHLYHVRKIGVLIGIYHV